MEAVAKHDFIPKQQEELGFKKDEVLYITNYGDSVSWYDAHKGSKKGLVPGNYIEVKRERWYMGRIPRSSAEQMLENATVGVFIVRLSESSPSDFSLSVKCNDAVQHFRILKDQSEYKYFLWNLKFDSINQLVDHYRHDSVSKTSQIFLRDDEEIFIAEALYNFEPSDSADGETELGFKEGERVVVFDTRDEHWWGGRIGDRSGFFPKTYVKKIRGPFVDQ